MAQLLQLQYQLQRLWYFRSIAITFTYEKWNSITKAITKSESITTVTTCTAYWKCYMVFHPLKNHMRVLDKWTVHTIENCIIDYYKSNCSGLHVLLLDFWCLNNRFEVRIKCISSTVTYNAIKIILPKAPLQLQLLL